jgi:hypothetical protein
MDFHQERGPAIGNQNCLQYNSQSKERSPDEEDTAVSDASRGEIGKERSH